MASLQRCVSTSVGLGLVGFLGTNRKKRSTHLNQKLSAENVFFKGVRLSAEPCASCGSGWSLLRCSGASTWRRRSTLEERVLQVARIRADIFLIWLILLILLISLTNPNMFVCACRYVIYQRIFLTARGSSIDSYVPRTAAVIPMPIPF